MSTTQYQWFYIFNREEFLDLGLVSKTYTVVLEGIGQKDVLVTYANMLAITYEGIFLPINLSDKNPFEFDDHAIYLDDETQNVWLGLPVGG